MKSSSHGRPTPILAAAVLPFILLLLVPPRASSSSSSSSSSSNFLPPPHNGEFPQGTLHNGKSIPLVGLGCASGVVKQHVSSALEIGYRYFDTAQSYAWGYREDDVGDAIAASIASSSPVPLNRDDVFIQTKIHPEDLGYSATKKAVDLSLKRLKVTRIDSVLIHKPHCWEGACTKKPEGTWRDSWKALEELYDAGVIGAIGICDVTQYLLEELLQQRIPPHIIQNWMDPFHQDKEMRNLCQRHNIQYQAYSTLGTQWVHHRGHKRNPVIHDPTLKSIAASHGSDVAQVVINWATRHGVSVLPASTNPTRQKSNLNSFEFDLTPEEMTAIDILDQKVTEAAPDPNEVSIVFENRAAEEDEQSKNVILDAYWVDVSSNEEVPVGSIGTNDGLSLNSFHGHKFVFKNAHTGAIVGEHTVEREGGAQQRHVVWDGGEEL